MTLPARFALPLAVIALIGATISARALDKDAVPGGASSQPPAPFDLCKLYCDKQAAGGLMASQIGNCFGLAFYVANDLSCGTPDAQKKEPCVSILKQFAFICPGPDKPQARNGKICSSQWMALCHKAGGLPYTLKPTGSPSKTPPGQKSDAACPPNMMRSAQGTCVPRLDTMPGSDSTLGSTPGATRTAPTGGGGGGTPAGRR